MEVATDLVPTLDGGYLIAGLSYSNDGDVSNAGGNTWLVKTNDSGTLEWQRNYLPLLHFSNPQSILLTKDSGYLLAGYARSNVNGRSYTYIIRIDDTGNVLWQKNIDSSYYSAQLIATRDGGYMLGTSADTTFPGAHGKYDYALVKLDSNGGIQWRMTYGGPGEDRLRMVRQTSDGGYIMAGEVYIGGSVKGSLPNTDYYVYKTDSNGIIEWQRNYGGFEADIAYDIQQTPEGGYIIAGTSRSFEGDVSGNHSLNADAGDAWIVKINDKGAIQWQKALGGTGDESATSILLTSDGDYVIGGYNQSDDGDVKGNHMAFTDASYDAWIVKMSASGNIRWQRSLGGIDMDFGSVVRHDKDGAYLLAGHAYSFDGDVYGNHGWSDYCVYKLNEVPTGLEQTPSIVSLRAYPNPTRGMLTVTTTDAGVFQLMNMQGQLVAQYTLQQGQQKIELPALSNGMYMARFECRERARASVMKLYYQR